MSLDAPRGPRHPAVAAAVGQADRWLEAIAVETGCDARGAYLALRATLHALRDRLELDDAIRLGARLPTLLRGIYFERFDAAERRDHGFDDVCAIVRHRLALVAGDRIDAGAACRAVLAVLERLLASGDLPGDVRDLLPRAGMIRSA